MRISESALRVRFMSLALAALCGSGCATALTRSIQEKGTVGGTYRSKLDEAGPNAPAPAPASLSVNKIAHEKGYTDGGVGTVALTLLPVASVFATANSRVELRDDELEKLLASELERSHAFRSVALAAEQSDFVLQGRVDLGKHERAHMSGLGILWSLGLVPVLFLPNASDEQRGEAHFEIVARRSQRTILSKDYHVACGHTYGLLYDKFERQMDGYGTEVFPEIVRQLVADIRALPREAWGL